MKISGFEFQSLFCWILGWNNKCSNDKQPHQEVSILVLLDLGLELHLYHSPHSPEFCFNPCSAGSWVGTIQPYYIPPKISSVSILVLLDLGLELVVDMRGARTGRDVSILVLLDLGLELRSLFVSIARSGSVSILVLLDLGLELIFPLIIY